MSAEIVKPTDFSIRSFHYRTLIEDGARFQATADAAVVLDYGIAPDEEVTHARHLGLADLSPLPRTGFKGGAAIEWLEAQGLIIDNENNRASCHEGAGAPVIARLADTEVLILGELAGIGERCERLNRAHAEQQ
nr:hypothetical protein [Gammaproteobacteria bacterium]